MPITQLLGSMTSLELFLHQVRYSRQAIGHDREDLRMARVAQTVANYAGRSLPEGEAKPITDFMLYGAELDEPAIDDETMATKLQLLAARFPQSATPVAANLPQEEVTDGVSSRHGS